MISHSMSSLQIGLGVLVVLSSVTTTISDNIDLVDIEGHIPPPIKRADKGVMPILPICESFAETLADAAANYTQCFIANARPMHLCTKCVEKYLAVKHAYHQLDAIVETAWLAGREVKRTCRDWILNADRVMAIQQTKTFFETLWKDSRCDNCFTQTNWKDGNISAPLAPHLTTYDSKYQLLDSCFANYTSQIIILNVTMKSNGMSKACNVCQSEYSDISQFYAGLNTDYGDELCMDIVDSMNLTRHVWASDFNCTGNTRQDGITITVTGLFFILPLVFYIGSHIHYQRIEKKIVEQKRMRRTRHSSSRAPTRPETPVIFEPEASTGTGPGIFQRWRNPTPTRSTTPTAT